MQSLCCCAGECMRVQLYERETNHKDDGNRGDVYY
jgi:hypothetical protein